MNNKKILFVLPFICLTACSGRTIYGTYSFGMGKSTGTSIYAAIELDDVDFAGKEGAKTFKLYVQNGNSDSWISEILNDGISGYFTNSGIKDKQYGTKLYLGAVINHDTYPSVIPEDTTYEIPTNLIEKVVTVYCNKKTTTIVIPVSLDDLRYQLAWYGYMIDVSNFDFEKLPLYKMPGFDMSKKDDAAYEASFLENRYGKHPVVEEDEKGNVISSQVTDMNNNYAKEFSETEVTTLLNGTGLIGKINDDYYYFPDNLDDVSSTSTIVGKIENTGATLTFDKNSPSTYNDGYKITEITVVNESLETVTVDKAEYEDMFGTPFTFRDFHDLRIGLTKEK